MADLEETLFNTSGVPVGRYRAHRPLGKKEREWAAAFCDQLVSNFKAKEKGMSKTNESKTTEFEFANMVALVGIIRNIKLQEGSGFLLLDVTGEEDNKTTKWIPCDVYKDEELVRRLDRYSQGDRLAVRGFVRSWSQKKDGEWKNAITIRITEIKSRDPEPKAKTQAKPREGVRDSGGKWPF